MEKRKGRPAREDGRNARTIANNKYNDRAYDRINLTVKSGNKEIIRSRAEAAGQSVNGYINALIAADIPGYETMDGGTV